MAARILLQLTCNLRTGTEACECKALIEYKRDRRLLHYLQVQMQEITQMAVWSTMILLELNFVPMLFAH